MDTGLRIRSGWQRAASAWRRLFDSYFLRRLLLCAVAVALPLLALHAYTLYRQAADAEAEAVAAVLARSEKAAQDLDAVLSRAERVLSFLATRQELKDLDGTRCSELIKGLTAIDPMLANVGAVNTEGAPLCLSIVSPSRFKSYKEVEWFKEALARPGAFLSKPFFGDISQRPLVNLVMPFANDRGERIGFLGAAIDLTRLNDAALARSGLPPGSVVSLLNGEGVIYARNPGLREWLSKPVPSETIKGEPRTDKTLFVGMSNDGVERLFARTRLAHYGLIASAGVPIAAVAAKGHDGLRRSVFAAFAVGLVGLLVAAYAVRRLTAPLQSLSNTARALAAGAPEARADDALPGEFRQLAIEFNRMIDTRHAAEASRRAQAAAEAASQAKSQFLAHMSHEIRTPMNAILGLTDLTLRTPLNDTQRRYLTQTRAAASSLLDIISDILDFSKIEAGKLELEMHDFALAAVLERVRNIVGLRAHDKGLALAMHVGADVPPILVGDALRLQQTLVNLCGNAVKFTSAGQVLLTVERTGTTAGGCCELRFGVRDTGPGMTPDQMSGLFTPFMQGDASVNREYGGTGLGLAISQQLVQLMGGHIGVQSAPGAGSEFHFTIAWAAGEAPSAGTGANAGRQDRSGHGTPAALKGARLLLVEDNELNRIVASDLLTHVAGAVVEIATNGQEALDALARSAPFDVVLMDVQMPGIDGYQATRLIRQDARWQHLPVIAMTAHATPSDHERCLQAGMNGYITKPFEPLELFGLLRHWVEAARRGSAAA